VLDYALLAPETPQKISRDLYDRMVSSGLLDDARVELLHGTIIEMSPNDPAHASPVDELNAILVPALAKRARVRIQQPLVAADDSEPEPDVAIVPLGDYRHAHPDQALLVIEIAASSLRKDRLVKAPLYAASNVREYWIVNVTERVVEVHRGPTAGGWASVTRHAHEETIAPEAFPDVTVRIADVLL
jgi:Uma2 family endonuclease